MSSPERQLEDIIIADLLTLQDLDGIPVRTWSDATPGMTLPAVIVHVAPSERVQPNYPFWRATITLTTVCDQRDDATAEEHSAISGTIADYLATLPLSTLSTVDGLTPDGLVPREPDVQKTDAWLMHLHSSDLFHTRTPVAPTITPTPTPTPTP